MVVLPLLYPEIYAKFSMSPPRGVLFHGPPGTGKTLLGLAFLFLFIFEVNWINYFINQNMNFLSLLFFFVFSSLSF